MTPSQSGEGGPEQPSASRCGRAQREAVAGLMVAATNSVLGEGEGEERRGQEDLGMESF